MNYPQFHTQSFTLVINNESLVQLKADYPLINTYYYYYYYLIYDIPKKIVSIVFKYFQRKY